MPMSGGTRMLRARRKDCNVKPNRRLDRKSSRGMLFENEELRMRTITINAEVEQGQHALKKLRRENEQLRREMWCLRDEYDKMEKLLRKREEGEESDQENSESDDNCGRMDDSEEEKNVGETGSARQEGEDNLQMLSQLGNETNARAFDGLSVIDEQTEETQTTESAVGYGTLSRGNSANRMFNQSSAGGDIPLYDYSVDPYGDRTHARKNASTFPGDWPPAPHDTYDARPASPYPYTGSFRPSYQKRLQLLQQLPQTPLNPIGDNGWIFPDPSTLPQIPNYNLYVDDPLTLLPPNPPATSDPTLDPTLDTSPPPPLGFHLIQDRAGPDLFVTGGYSHPQPPQQPHTNDLQHLHAEIDKIEIREKSESDPKAGEMTTLTKSAVSRGAEGLPVPTEPHQTLPPGKLTMDAPVHQNHNSIANHLRHSVPCQESDGQHVRETTDTVRQPATNTPPPEDMPLTERPTTSKYQTKLTVTLKAPKKVPGPVVPRTFHPQPRSGSAPDHARSFQTLPSLGIHPNAGDSLPPLCAPVRPPAPGPFASLPRLPTFAPKTDAAVNAPYNIPRRPDNHSDALPHQEPPPVTQPPLKPIKIPPPPPPRTSSCPKPIIPPTSVGLTALHRRTSSKGQQPLQSPDEVDRPPEPTIYNPLLMSQPIATSSPTISFRGTNQPAASAEGLFHSRYRKTSYTEDSSLEEFSRQKSKVARDEFPRGEVPKLNKSLSSPSFGSFRTGRRKQSEMMATSVENMAMEKGVEVGGEGEGEGEGEEKKGEKKGGKGRGSQNNASVSSSSGVESPTKSDGRKRRVSIQLKKKKKWEGEGERERERDGDGEKGVGMGKGGGGEREKGRGRGEETDGTMSERERTNSVSSRTSSVVAGSSRRKYSVSSNRTYLNEEKIPWCGCWGNGCV